MWCFCSLILPKWQWPWNNFCQQYYSTSFFLVKYILFISRFKKEKKDILIFITIKKNNIRIMRRFTTCFKFFSKSCCMYRAMRLQNEPSEHERVDLINPGKDLDRATTLVFIPLFIHCWLVFNTMVYQNCFEWHILYLSCLVLVRLSCFEDININK